MTWYGLVNPSTRELVSVGTEAMFADKVVPSAGQKYQGLDVLTFGASAPDMTAQVWDSQTKSLKTRPAPILISRLDDVEAWLLADPDFAAVWAGLSAARKTQLRRGWRAVVSRLLGPQVNRQESEVAEL